ncbi:LPXTG-motif cell wall anchor domain-containing protein [Actinacidiphila alni]|uniref:LPXTG-motif cell wall anchor domain-containing protein n=1 Tax=Actinacidiphila alni TaxID=380248 RepID=A0A1I2C2E5_9ACTN|nr:LAETG motif-containing sortase-dependent surface protein [Actinacidiphila alni]SFE62454.1 LPXTG-motif cell wall anchor domain-containing protein [Actinacidiphila alni]
MQMTRQGRRRSGVIAGAGMAALIGSAVLAAPASAHNSDWSVTCSSVSVHLTAYNGRVTNSVTLSVDGGAVLTQQNSFGDHFDFTGALPEHTAAIKVHLVVTAGDGKQYSRDEYKTSEPCEKPPTTPPTTPSTPPPTTPATPTTSAPTTTPPTTPATTPTTNAPVVQASTSPASGDLAETGSSSATPMIAGIAAAVVAAGAGLLLLNRRRGTHR